MSVWVVQVYSNLVEPRSKQLFHSVENKKGTPEGVPELMLSAYQNEKHHREEPHEPDA
ncbi:hypothetical protein LILPANDA_47 [Klebsiella phage vB_KaeM_LilPanda]|nr:hypothetical protein LILPANDA_47 [Klebsiella phage vB_KaeM_LilPanda]